MKNKKKNIKSLIYQLFKKKVSLPDNGEHLRIKIINDQVQTISESLGITEERRLSLISLVKNKTNEIDNIVHIMVNISNEITHQNELAYAIYVLGNVIEKESNNPMHRFITMIGSKFNGED